MKPLHIFNLLLICLPLLAAEKGNGRNIDASFQRLMEGNQRYVAGESINAGNLEEKRQELANSQVPFAIVLGCSDSRVPPEIIFDQSLGDIFVVRVAANALGPIELDSIEYAVEVLNSPFIMVLGHQRCGAVDAVLKGQAKEQDLGGIVPYIQKSVKQSKNLPGDPLVNAIKENVRETVKTLKAASDLKEVINRGKLKIVGAYYSFDTGQVEVL
jgi:carbonic anhydrase